MTYVNVYCYSERQDAMWKLLMDYVPNSGIDPDTGRPLWNIYVGEHYMSPGTVVLKLDDPDTPEEETEYDEDNWYANFKIPEDMATALLDDIELIYEQGVQIKHYPSQRQPGVEHHFPFYRQLVDTNPDVFENVYFTRRNDGVYFPNWPRSVWLSGQEPGTPTQEVII